MVCIIFFPCHHYTLYQKLRITYVIYELLDDYPRSSDQTKILTPMNQSITNLWQHIKASINSAEREIFIKSIRCSLWPVIKGKKFFWVSPQNSQVQYSWPKCQLECLKKIEKYPINSDMCQITSPDIRANISFEVIV